MKNKLNTNLKLNRILSLLVIFLGTTLIAFMITNEGELGALPLFLTLTGIVWFLFNYYRIKKYRKQ